MSAYRYNARIRVPERGTQGEAIDGIPAENCIQIIGRDTKCEAVKQALLELIPITRSIAVPLDYHSSLIGRSGEAVRALMNAHAVRVKIPPAGLKCEEIEVTGRAENIEQAFAEIREKMTELDRQSEDRVCMEYAELTTKFTCCRSCAASKFK